MSNRSADRSERRSLGEAWLVTHPCWWSRSGTASDSKAKTRADLFGASMAEALQKPGCPVCVSLADSDRQHIFCFLNGNDSEPLVIDGLIKSHGLCPEHGAVLMACPANDSAVAQLQSHRLDAAAVTTRTNPSFDLHFSQRAGTFHVIIPSLPDCLA